MAPISSDRKLSFVLLTDGSPGDGEIVSFRPISDPIHENGGEEPSIYSPRRPHRRKNRTKGSKKKTNLQFFSSSQPNGSIDSVDAIHEETSICDSNFIDQESSTERSCVLSESELGYRSLNTQASVCETITETGVSDIVEGLEKVYERVDQNFYPPEIELRRRSVNVNGNDKISDSIEPVKGENASRPGSSDQLRSVVVDGRSSLETAESLDWERLMEANSTYLSSGRKLPLQYFIGEIYRGNSLRTTTSTSIGSEKKRQRVYNTMFHVPWRCELFQRPSAAELSDFGCFVIVGCGVALLQATDISFIYHFIRGQGTVKLYVVYNVLEILDRLCQSFGVDVLQVLFSSAEGVANCSLENITFEVARFILDQTIAVVAFIVHSFVLLAQAITLSTCIVAHNNALLALLVSNNFSEIKSNVFKRFSKENLHDLSYHDTVERFHITAFLIFVLGQNILEADGPWFESFLTTLDIESDNGRKNLTFVPLSPACVVIRVLSPIYASRLPPGPLEWRLLWIILLSSVTYIMLAILKLLVGMGLNLHATWYVNRCLKRRNHLHLD